uniref:Uncharacterized protein n=1 Tax=Cacopsylla melanoneura TaxID=428564 RepID=A0A8D9E863_9HEMI
MKVRIEFKFIDNIIKLCLENNIVLSIFYYLELSYFPSLMISLVLSSSIPGYMYWAKDSATYDASVFSVGIVLGPYSFSSRILFIIPLTQAGATHAVYSGSGSS